MELTYRAIEAFNRRDLDAYLAVMDPKGEFTPYEVWVQGGEPYHGHVSIRSWWEETFEVLPHLSGRGKTSGLDLGQVQTSGAALLHVRGGKVTRLALYSVRDHALGDLGLKE